jgi:hypothetical protein
LTVHKDFKEHKDCRVVKEHLAQMVLLDLKVCKACRDHKERKAFKEDKVELVILVHRDSRDFKVTKGI